MHCEMAEQNLNLKSLYFDGTGMKSWFYAQIRSARRARKKLHDFMVQWQCFMTFSKLF